ncbi:hypothetical protein EPN54_04680, partial [bacterium]
MEVIRVATVNFEAGLTEWVSLAFFFCGTIQIMPKKITKILSIFICFLLIFQQSGFSQIAGELDLSSHFARLGSALFQPDTFRPL